MSTTASDQAVGPAPFPARRTSPTASPTPSPAATSMPNGVRLHAVVGGDGPPLLLIHGWPGKLVLLAPASCPRWPQDFEVVAADQRGIGLSDKPEDGYDAGTLAQRPGRADGRARSPALRRGRRRHRDGDRATPWLRITPSASSASRVGEAFLPGHHPAEPAGPPGRARSTASGTSRSTSSTETNEKLVTRTRGHLLRRGVRRLGRDEQAARGGRRVLRRRARLEPRGAARQLPALPGVRGHRRRRTRSARLGGCRCRCSRWAEPRARGEGAANTMKLVADDVQTPGHSRDRPLARRTGARAS